MNFFELLCLFGVLLIVVGGPVWLLTGHLEQGFAVAGFTGLVAAGSSLSVAMASRRAFNAAKR